MTTAVTKESLAARIAELESGTRSLKEDYTLAAYKMLLATMEAEPVADVAAWSHPNEERKCDVRWRRHDVEPGPLYRHAQPASVVPDEVLKSLDLLLHRSYFRRWIKDPQGYVVGPIPVRDLVNVVLFADACRAAMLNQK